MHKEFLSQAEVDALLKGVTGIDNEVTKPTNPKMRVGIRKASLSVVPAQVLAEVGVAMTEGALKYEPYNYREAGGRASVYYDATIRHLFSWWEGEDIDPDSQLSHVTKAISSLVVLRDLMLTESLTDDRPNAVKPFYARLNNITSAMIDKHQPE